MPKTKMTTKGQVTIPKGVRDNLGLRPGDEIEFLQEGTYCRVKKVVKETHLRPGGGGSRTTLGGRSDDLVDEMRGDRVDNGG